MEQRITRGTSQTSFLQSLTSYVPVVSEKTIKM